MTIKEFVKAFYPHAKIVQDKTGISAVAILAQAALESGWGKFAPGNMFFGVKDTDGVNGNEQLITTSEFHSTMNVKYPVVISITPTVRNGRKLFKYKVKDYFRKYNTPADCFNDHAQFFFKNKRYAKALLVKSDPIKFIDEVAKAGYATAPDYATILKSVANSIQKHI